MKKAEHIRVLIAGSVSLITFLVYLTSLRNEFVEWDDNYYVYENPDIRKLGIMLLRWAFLGFHVSNWHPLTWISHAVDYALWGLNPLGHHLTSIMLHSVNTFLVVLLVIKLMEISKKTTMLSHPFCSPRGMLITGAATGILFGLHPLHVESVAWISERKDVLCALFFLLSIWSYAEYIVAGEKDPGSKTAFACASDKRYLLSLGFFILAILSKPMAVTLPVVLLILDWYPFQRITSFESAKTAVMGKLPFLALSIGSSVMTVLAQTSGRAIVPLEYTSFPTRVVVAAQSLIIYLEKMVLPVNLIPFYPYPRNISFLSPEYIVPIVLVAGITWISISLTKKTHFFLAAWSFYVLTLLPVLGIIQVGDQSMADRYTYLPSLGPFFALGLGAAWLGERELIPGIATLASRVAVAVLAAVLITAMSYVTMKQIAIWRNSITLWNHEIEREPNVPIAYNNRGLGYEQLGFPERAIEDFSRAIALNPRFDVAYYNRGKVLDKMGRLDRAIEDYTAAITINPLDYQAYNNRGLGYDHQGLADKAMEDFTKAIAIHSKFATAYANRGMVLEKMGQHTRALEDFNRAIALDPLDYQAYNNRGLGYGRSGIFDKAIHDFTNAITINPRYELAYLNRGLTFQLMGAYDRAVEDFSKAILLNRSNAEAYVNRGYAFLKKGTTKPAFSDFQMACALGNSNGCSAVQQFSGNGTPGNVPR